MERDLVENVRIMEGGVLGIETLQDVGMNGLVNLLFCLCHRDGQIT